MPKIEKSIFINAPLEKVFAFMAEPGNLPEIWPSLLEIKNVRPLPNGGYCYDWTYKMGGLHFQGQSETIEFVKDQRIAARSEAGIPNTFVWAYQAEEGGTRVTVSVDYVVPVAILGKLAEPIVHKFNEKESETILFNLKACMEGGNGSF
jgi:uncharacterized membrane protein